MTTCLLPFAVCRIETMTSATADQVACSCARIGDVRRGRSHTIPCRACLSKSVYGTPVLYKLSSGWSYSAACMERSRSVLSGVQQPRSSVAIRRRSGLQDGIMVSVDCHGWSFPVRGFLPQALQASQLRGTAPPRPVQHGDETRLAFVSWCNTWLYRSEEALSHAGVCMEPLQP